MRLNQRKSLWPCKYPSQRFVIESLSRRKLIWRWQPTARLQIVPLALVNAAASKIHLYTLELVNVLGNKPCDM
jgi:hypothetical protein